MDDVPTADKTGGWCAPSACGAGICQVNAEHDASCAGPGSAYAAYAKVDFSLPPLELPSLTVKRGGIWFARFPVYTTIVKTGFREFHVQIRVHGREETSNIGPYPKRKQAQHTKDTIDDTIKLLQALYEGRA